MYYVLLSIWSPTACKYSINPHYPCIGVLGPSAPAPATAMSARNTTTGGGDRAGEELAGMEKRHRSCYRAKYPLGVLHVTLSRRRKAQCFRNVRNCRRMAATWSRCETRSVDQWSKLAPERIYITQQYVVSLLLCFVKYLRHIRNTVTNCTVW